MCSQNVASCRVRCRSHTDNITDRSAVSKTSGGLSSGSLEIDPVRRNIGPRKRCQIVIVAGVDEGVTEQEGCAEKAVAVVCSGTTGKEAQDEQYLREWSEGIDGHDRISEERALLAATMKGEGPEFVRR